MSGSKETFTDNQREHSNLIHIVGHLIELRRRHWLLHVLVDASDGGAAAVGDVGQLTVVFNSASVGAL